MTTILDRIINSFTARFQNLLSNCGLDETHIQILKHRYVTELRHMEYIQWIITIVYIVLTYSVIIANVAVIFCVTMDRAYHQRPPDAIFWLTCTCAIIALLCNKILDSSNIRVKYIYAYLEDNGIRTMILSNVNIMDKIAQFRDEDYTVCLLNSTEICAGVNIEFCTDIVFINYINDTSVRNQLIGRGARITRKYMLNIYQLKYESEVD